MLSFDASSCMLGPSRERSSPPSRSRCAGRCAAAGAAGFASGGAVAVDAGVACAEEALGSLSAPAAAPAASGFKEWFWSCGLFFGVVVSLALDEEATSEAEACAVVVWRPDSADEFAFWRTFKCMRRESLAAAARWDCGCGAYGGRGPGTCTSFDV